MADPRHAAFAVLTAAVVLGTAYSVVYTTYLDTSNPILTHLPHPLSHTHYFANKANILNVYFIKKAWGWTTGLFLLSWLTSPPHTRTTHRLVKWALATFVWAVFTMWFFGPPLLDRVIVASGGVCMVRLPSGEAITLPVDTCYAGTPVGPSSHPTFFTEIATPSDWKVLPRLRRGHDVSGHIFLLTLSILFLADQLRPSLCLPNWTLTHKLAILANALLIGIWLLASSTTALYFHSPLEKVSGYLLGVGGFLLTQLAPWGQLTPISTVEQHAHSE